MQKPPRFLKFNPLLPKYGSFGPSLYTGVPLWPASDAYYQQLKKPVGVTSANLAPSKTPMRTIISPVEVDAGDAVEVVGRNGLVEFGLVSWAPVGPYFDLISLNGRRSSHAVKNVSVALKSWVEPALHLNPSEVALALQGLVAGAWSHVAETRNYLRVIYAQSALQKRVRAVDFQDICRRVWSFHLQNSARHAVKPISPPSQLPAEIQLATYLAAAYHELGFVRWRRGPFVAASFSTVDVVHKVMYALTEEELDHGGAQLRVDPNITSGIGFQLRRFLEHYAIWSDARLGRAAEAILTKVYPDRGEADASVALSDRLLGDTPLLHMLTQDDGITTSMAPKNAVQNVSTLETAKAWSLADDIAISVDPGADNGWDVALYIPYVPIKSVLGVRGVGTRARSVRAGTYHKLPLIDQSTRESMSFSDERPSIALSLRIPTDKNFQWDPNDVEVGLVSCTTRSIKPQYFDKNLNDKFQESSQHSLWLIEAFLATSPDSIPAYEFLGGTEAAVRANLIAGQLSQAYGKKKGLEIPKDGGVGRPFDSSLALLTQRQLLKPRSLTAQEPLDSHVERSILPNWWLADLFEERFSRYEVLSGLQEELKVSSAFHIFRCIILQPATYPGLARAWCRDIDLEVEVSVLPHTRLFEGDQIICNEMLELDPVQGLIVLSM